MFFLFNLILGPKTSLRYTVAIKIYQKSAIAREIYYTLRYPWHTVKKLSCRLTGHNAHVRIGKNNMEVSLNMFDAFIDGDYYEKNVSYWLEKILLSTNHKVFYDIGANYGYYSLKFSAHASHIYAFEPVFQTHQALLKNTQSNNLENVTVYKLGLSDKRSNMEINLYNSSGNNSLFLRDVPNTQKGYHSKLIGQEIVGLVPLDIFTQEEKLNPPDLIKIDIEGGELYALKGARETIKKYRPVLVMEFDESIFKDAGYSRSDILAELKVNNYVIYGIPTDFKDLNVYLLDKANNIEIGNIIAIPSGMEDIINAIG